MIFKENKLGSLLFYGVRLPQEEGSSSVDELLTLGINSDMRCPMQTEKTLTVDSKSSESNGLETVLMGISPSTGNICSI